MKPFTEKQGIGIKGEEGMALLTALIIMVMLTGMGLAGIYLASTDLMISQNYKKIKQKFYTAEAGLEQGINILRSTSIDDWNDLIETAKAANPEVILSGMSDVPFQGMWYTIRVKNNLDDPVFWDANHTVDEQCSTDTDDILVVISECKANEGEPKYIETAVQWEPNPVHSYGGKDITTDNINVVEANIDWT
ncbi:MAG: PilX N-terminal domain-containing pilus assembly protein [bacterium]